MNYQELREKNSQEITAFPVRFAFSDGQLNDIMQEWNIEKDKLCGVGAGAVVRKSDAKKYYKMFENMNARLEKALKNDKFLTDALRYELDNHEFTYTYSVDSALDALGLDSNNLTEREERCLKVAKKQCIDWQEKHG